MTLQRIGAVQGDFASRRRHCEERSDDATQGPRDVAPGLLHFANKKQKAIMLIVLDNLQRKAWCVGVENVAQFSTSFIHGGRRKARCRTNKKQTVTALILLEKLCTEKEKRRHRF
jgi:hypothetical protein